ncbi:PEP/pyruvate-binding domain-containing protein [Dictyobacter aurantiacus]|uniref:Phosphoenolpyruvate synthase n=1 Tax=Dictyobacter aurantiacus TaxID=1936993 RepID=A0A401ZRG2_9CHLR|nr:PEP/pyruvate-binding domain-containing protein [Dictyobacter aurantiacus]GCE09443.1 hypothetical protein KDAU_67720 [Dictyobacter aurantiacus]
MEYICALADVQRQEVNVAGGKGANLGALIHAGFPVPAGFILLTEAYQHFLDTYNLLSEIEHLEQSVTPGDITSCERAAQAIRTLFMQHPIPDVTAQAISQVYQQLDTPGVAIRSSATTEDSPVASFAGLHESYLNVGSLEDVFTAVQQCWSSLWTPRAMSYRARLGLSSQRVSMAVIIQQMVPAVASGVLFTVNPVSGSREEMMINAVWGIGEALVSGQITPESILIEKVTGCIRRQGANGGIGTALAPSVLSDEQVEQLISLGERIEKHFGMPYDIEWTLVKGQIFIVQARPITTLATTLSLSANHDLPIPPGDDSWDREQDQPPQPYDIWTRTNVGENLPYPVTPLTETHFPVIFGLDSESSQPNQPQMVRRLYGRLYFNEGALVHSFTEELGLPASWLHKIWGSRPRGAQLEQNAFRPWRLSRRLFLLVTRPKPKKKKVKTPKDSPEQFFAHVDQWVNDFERIDLDRLDDEQLWQEGLPTWSQRGAYAWAANMRFSIGAAISYGILERIVHWWAHKDLAQDLVTGLPGVYSAEVGPDLWQMARIAQEGGIQEWLLSSDPRTALDRLRSDEGGRQIIAQLAAFLARHGHRCPNELEMRNPRWAEEPEQVIELIASYLNADKHSDPVMIEARQRQRRTVAVSTVESGLDPIRRLIFRFVLARAQRAVAVRDNSRYTMVKFLFPVRKIYAELGRRWVEAGQLTLADDIFFLTIPEIEQLIATHGVSPEVQTSIEQRRLAYDFWFTMVAPEALNAYGTPITDEGENAMRLQGMGVSGGTMRGRARIIKTMQEAMQLTSGDIFVTSATDPGWTPVFPLVGGIVLEIGGQLSHGAIIAREYGIPAIVNVPGAMRLIRDGQIIAIDGSTGIIKLS